MYVIIGSKGDMMNIIANKIYVDAGLIMVADPDYLGSCPSPDTKDLKRLGKSFDIPNGKYKVSWFIPYQDEDGEEGEDNICEGHDELTVTSGKIFVCDPCYIVGKKNGDWQKWLDATKYGDEPNDPRAFTITSTGGDGCFKVVLEIEKI
jgi:hypothetical protein